MILFIVKFCILVLAAITLAVLYAKYAYTPATAIPVNQTPREKGSKKWAIVLISISLLFYAFLSYLLSLSWLGCDDYFFPHNVPFTEHFSHAVGKYCNGVSRLGESIVCLTGVSENRWQHVVMTPIFIILLPFTLFRLVKREQDTIFSAKGVIFYVLIISLLISQVPGFGWRNFRCYAAATNYLWPLVTIALFLSYYRADAQFNSKKLILTVPVFFLMGLYVGWSVECIACLIAPAMLITCIVKAVRKRCYVPHLSGLLGILFGVFFIFSSPALAKRAAWASRDSLFNVQEMSFSEAFEFACSITPQNMHQLGGAAIPAYIGDFPFILRPLFFPELMSQYIPFCTFPLAACLIFSLLICFSKQKNKKRTFIIALSGAGISFLCATTYLMACIPYSMSFLPAMFFLLATAGYLMLRTPLKRSLVVGIPMLAYMLYFLIPSMCEAYDLVPARDAQLQLIQDKISKGETDIVLPYPYPYEPVDRLYIIRQGLLSPNPEDYPNHLARQYFKVNTIRTLPKDEKNKKQAP